MLLRLINKLASALLAKECDGDHDWEVTDIGRHHILFCRRCGTGK